MHISKMQEKIEKKRFVSDIISSEFFALNFLLSEENPSYQQSMF